MKDFKPHEKLTLNGTSALTKLQAEALIVAATAAMRSFDIGNNSCDLTGRQRKSLEEALSKLDWAHNSTRY